MSNMNNQDSNIDLSEDLNIDEIEENDNKEDQNNLNQDESISFDDINELDNELNIDDDIEIKEDLKIDENFDLDSDLELPNIDNNENIDNNLDLDNSNTDYTSLNIDELSNTDTTDENDINLEDLDLQRDLGLEDKLSISDEEEKELKESDFNFDLSDDEGNPIGESEEEYGVDIKSKPITINSFEIEKDDKDDIEDKIFPEQDEETLRSIAEDIEKEIEINEITDKKEAIDSGSLIDKEIDTNGLVIGEAESKELDEVISLDQESDEFSDIPSEDLDIDFAEISQDELTEEIIENQNLQTDDLDIDTSDIDEISEDLDEDILSDNASDELLDIPSEDLDIDLAEISQDEFTEEINENQDLKTEEDFKIDTSDIDEISEDLKENISSDFTSDELPDISSEDIDIDLTELNDDFQIEKIDSDQDIAPEDLDVDLSEEEIQSINDNFSDIEEEIDLSEIEIPSKFESEIIDESSNKKISMDDDTESINIEDSELKNIENNILQDDQLLSEIDQEITKIESDLSTKSPSTSGSDNEFKINFGNLDEIDLDNIPQPTSLDEETEEIDSISLSSDELDIVTADAKIVESQQDEIMDSEEIKLDETEFDFANFDENESDAYNDLKKEMIEKTDISDDQNINSLRQNVKVVLEYLDQLLDALPEEKIKEFAESKVFEKYKKLFEELRIKN